MQDLFWIAKLLINRIEGLTEPNVYFHINTLFTNICDRVIIDSSHKITHTHTHTYTHIYIYNRMQCVLIPIYLDFGIWNPV